MIKNKTKRNIFVNKFYIILLLCAILMLVILPQVAISSFSQGILIWGTKVLPALLPFFILTNLLSYTTFTATLGKYLSPITKKLYGVGGASGYVYIMSIISGYPVGAKLTADLYRNNIITKGQAKSITAFTSTSGPLFIIGTVGIGFFQSQKIGIIVLFSHLISALINGLLYKCKENKSINNIESSPPHSNVLNTSMTNSITSIMIVGGFIALFYMLLNLLNNINAFALPIMIFKKLGIQPNITNGIISGLIEVTTGAINLSLCGLNTELASIILSFLVSFGGLSIHTQAYCFLKEFDMPYWTFLIQKITHAIISASVTFVIFLFI